ncbi:MAG TPA: hypothetical protein VIH57_17250, partial [Bacteroidales bacterium]
MITKKNYATLFCLLAINISMFGQPQLEKLDRGLIAVKIPEGVFISWRLLGYERNGVSFNLYRNGKKISTSPIAGATNFTDKKGT